jgi:capsular polysaccharide biosynthesis protein
MELNTVWQMIVRRGWLALVPLVLVVAVSASALLDSVRNAGSGHTSAFRYSAAQSPQAALPPRDGDYQDIWLASEYTVNAMNDWIRSSSFKHEVSEVLAAQGTPLDVGGLGVGADEQRSVGLVTLVWGGDAAQLNDITAAAITVMQTRTQAYFPQLGGQPAQVTILDQPTVTANARGLTERFGPWLRVLLALAVGVGLAALAEYLDTTVRRRAALEGLGLRVIAVVPRKR